MDNIHEQKNIFNRDKNFKIESNANTKIKTTSSQMNFLIDLSADWKRLRKKLMNLKIGQ